MTSAAPAELVDTLIGVVLDGAPCAFEPTGGPIGEWPVGLRGELTEAELPSLGASGVRVTVHGSSLLSGVVLALTLQAVVDGQPVRLAWLPSRAEGVRLVHAGSRVLIVLDLVPLGAVQGRVVVELLVVPA